MVREEYLHRLVDEAYVELYLSANDGARIFWPWRMQPPKEASNTYREMCDVYIIDSDINDPSVGNKTALDCATRVGADVCALTDYMPFDYYEKNLDPDDNPEKWNAYKNLTSQYDTAYEATIDSLRSGIELVQEHEFDGTILIPMQSPYLECWKELGEPTDDWIGIGGLKDASDAKRILELRKFRSAIGDEAHIHGFGWGPSEEIASEIRQTPSIIDSLDYSTPIRNTPERVTPGDEIMSVQASYAYARLVRDLREVSPHPKQTPVSERAQTATTDFF